MSPHQKMELAQQIILSLGAILSMIVGGAIAVFALRSQDD